MKGTILVSAVAGALILAGCGGGGKSATMTGPRTPTRTLGPGTIPLPTGHTLETGAIPTGETRTVRETGGMRTRVRCSADSENCIIMVADDGIVTLIAGSLRIEIEGITVVTPTTPTPTPDGPTVSITWEQLPGLVDRMADYATYSESYLFPRASSNDFLDVVMETQVALRVILEAATKPTGTMRRFQGTRTVQLDGRDSVTGSFWGGWLDNSIFLVENIPGRNYINTRGDLITNSNWRRQISAGINEPHPQVGVYQGDAVDRDGNWGASESDYLGGQLDLTINIPVHGEMRWSNIPVEYG